MNDETEPRKPKGCTVSYTVKLSDGRAVACIPFTDGSFGLMFTSDEGVNTQVVISRQALEALRTVTLRAICVDMEAA